MHEKYSERGIHTESTQNGVYAQEVLREGYMHEKNSKRAIHMESTQRGVYARKVLREGYTHGKYSERDICMESTQSGSKVRSLTWSRKRILKHMCFTFKKLKLPNMLCVTL